MKMSDDAWLVVLTILLIGFAIIVNYFFGTHVNLMDNANELLTPQLVNQ